MKKIDIKPTYWLDAPTENKWYLRDLNSPANTGGQYFRRKCWNTEAEAQQWLDSAFMDDVIAIRGEK